MEELKQFHAFLLQYKIIVYSRLSPDKLSFVANSESNKNLLYDLEHKHYDVISSIMIIMAKKYICNGCHYLCDNTHNCEKSCSLCTAFLPCCKGDIKQYNDCHSIFLNPQCMTTTRTSKFGTI
jgi:hypothetical protein